LDCRFLTPQGSRSDSLNCRFFPDFGPDGPGAFEL